LQESISVVRTAWDDLDLEAIVPELAKGSLSRSDIEGICIRNGVFCELVETMAQSANFGEAMLRLSKSGSLATELPSINRVIAAWTGPLSKKRLSRTLELQEHILGHNEHVFDDDIDEDDLLSVTGKPSRARTSLSAVARQVAHKNALDKVSQIVALVSSGESERARALIDHLVAFQTETSGIDHVLKSLCNVATQCRRLLRDDIAIECLIKALALSSKDAVTFSQLGTQLRDCDLFEEARQAYDKSLSLLDRDDLFHKQITLSARAYVLTEQGKYEDALTEYRSIPFGDDSFSVRTAIADVYRRQGYLATAMSEYVKLLRDDRKWDRAWAGKAEIAKRRGDPHRAIRIYNSLLDPAKFQIDEVSRSVYELASCQLYKRVGQYDKALSLANSILEREPHLFGAKLQLSSLLTLKGNAADGLRQILRPAGSTQSTNWRVELLEGLTLYRLRRAAEARKHLLERIDLSSVLSEDQPMIRCSMAYAHLSAQDSESALTVLRATHPVDRGLRNLKTILEAHANILLDDTRTGTGISLSRMPRSHRYLRSAVDSVRAGNLADAALAELSYLIIAV
jgi:tetratricopeptide (TPR) repeat protein